MDAGPDAVQTPPGLGPISPELVLVDPVLAEWARALLPDPPRPRPLPAPVEVAAESFAPPARRHRGRTVVLAGLIFASGAASGNLLTKRHAESSPPGVTFAAQVEATSTPSTQTKPNPAKRRAAQRTSTRRRRPLEPPAAATGKRRPAARPTASSRTKRKGQPARKVTWAANVLGVTARVASPSVTIVWKRPANSSRVVVLRARGAHKHGVVVFRGRATSYRDASPRRCTAYRYTIVNYDRLGHRSTGVPTSILTAGCV